MTEWLLLAWAACAITVLAFGPGLVWARIARIPWLLALAAAPALTAGGFGASAIIAATLGLPWSLWAAAAATALGALVALLLRWAATSGVAVRAPRPLIPASGRLAASAGIALAAIIAVAPIIARFPGPDAILQRWDALYHLSAIQHVRSTGNGSSLELGALAYTDGRTGIYPAAFHDIAALVPGVSTPITLNAAALVLATVPWALGMAVLVRVLWPRLAWGPTAAAILALLAPAAPLNEWVHLSPTPNLVGFACLPGLLALMLATWREVRSPARPRIGALICLAAVLGLGTLGIALLHPNVLVALSLLAALATALDAAHLWRAGRRSPLLLAVPVLAAAPTLVIVLLPGSAVTGAYAGGLVVPWWQGIGEIGLGLLTVWPMALGIAVWALAWVGIWALARRGTWSLLAWAFIAALLYLDAAVDSTLGLSALWYRGQDRLAMLATMVAVVCAVAGLAHLQRWWRRTRTRRPSLAAARWLPGAALGLAALLALSSAPTRYDNAALNLDLDMPGRHRYFDTEEWEMLKEVGPTLDPDATLLASPFSGGAHLFAMTGQRVHFPVAGQTYASTDPALIAAPALAATDPAACELLTDAGIRYVYVDRLFYNYAAGFDPLTTSRVPLGEPLASTDHSALYEVRCTP